MAPVGKINDDNTKNISSVGELSNTVSVLREAIKGFVDAAEALDDAAEDLLTGITKEGKDTDKRREAKLAKLEGISKRHLTKSEAITSAFVNSLSQVSNYAIKQFTDASNKVIANYNESLTAITVRQNWSNAQYTRELKEATDWIRNNGLVTQFSQIDWTSSLQDAMAMGLRDEVAQRVAEQNLITHKLLPQLSLNSRTYTRASKLLGDTLSENIVAIGKYTEQVYGAEGLEDNQINNVLETIMNEIIAGGAQRGLSKDEVSEQVANVLGTYQQYSAQYGAQYAEQVLGTLKGVMTGDLNDTMANMAMTSANIGVGDASTLNADSLAKYFEAYTGATRMLGNQAGAGVMAGMAGIGNYDSYLAVKIADAYGESYQSWMDLTKSVDAGTEYDKELGKLQEGWYQSITDQQTKWNENAVSKISDTIAQYVPSGAIGLLTGLIGTWFSAWKTYMASKSLGGGVSPGGTSNPLSFTTNGSSFGSVLKDQWAARGTGFTGEIGRNSLSTLGKVAGGASLAAGLIWAGADAISSGKLAYQNNMSTGQIVGQGARGFLTGSDVAGMTKDERAAYWEQQGYKINLSEVAKNATKWGLIGGGAGTLAGGPLGTLIGGGAGVAVGAITSAIDQYADMHHFKELAEASEEAANAVQKLSDASSNYEQAMQSSSDALDSLDVLQNQSIHTTQEVEQAFNNLKQQFPEYMSSMSDVSQWDKDYVEVIKAKVEYEKSQATKEMMNAIEGTSVSTTEYSKDFMDAATYDFATWASTHKNASESEYNAQIQKIADKYYEGDTQKVLARVSGNLGRGVVNYTAAGEFQLDTGNGSSAFNYDYESKLGTAQSSYNEMMLNQWPIIEQSKLALITAFNNEDVASTKQAAEDLSNELNTLYTSVKSTPFVDDFRLRYKNLGDLSEYYSYANVEEPRFFKLGSDYIRADGQRAILHKGEAVLTASAAERLRSLAGNSAGLSGFITDLFNLSNSKVSAVGEDTTLSFDPIISAIQEQTAELKDSLSEIATLVASILDPTVSAKVDQRLITYQGAGGY